MSVLPTLEVPFRIALGSLIVLFFVVRAVNHNRAIKEGGDIEYREHNARFIAAMRGIVGMLWVASMLAYLINPNWVALAHVELPLWLRWVGVVIGYVSLPLIWWTEFSLGKNFNTTLHVREGHTLVTAGPYRWVRHPMYTGLMLFSISAFPITANLLIGLPPLLALIVIIVNRIDAEEALMVEQFGEDYRAYMQRTGRFLPRIRA